PGAFATSWAAGTFRRPAAPPCRCRCQRSPPASSRPPSKESTMRLAVLRGPHALEVTDAPVPQIEPDEVLVRVASWGVCTSELDMWEGHAELNGEPLFPGHEVSGVVEEVGDEV